LFELLREFSSIWLWGIGIGFVVAIVVVFFFKRRWLSLVYVVIFFAVWEALCCSVLIYWYS
jgi:hypothetical protein